MSVNYFGQTEEKDYKDLTENIPNIAMTEDFQNSHSNNTYFTLASINRIVAYNIASVITIPIISIANYHNYRNYTTAPV